MLVSVHLRLISTILCCIQAMWWAELGHYMHTLIYSLLVDTFLTYIATLTKTIINKG